LTKLKKIEKDFGANYGNMILKYIRTWCLIIEHNFINNGYNYLKFSQNVARYLLIVKKFRNDSFIYFWRNFGRWQKRTVPGPNRVKLNLFS